SANITYGDDELGTMQVTFSPTNRVPDQVKVDIQVNAKPDFARVLGFNETPVSVSATVKVGSIGRMSGGGFPVGIVDAGDEGLDDDFVTGKVYELTLGPGGGLSGNFGWLNFDSVDEFDTYIEEGFDGVLEVDDLIDTKTGVSTGVVQRSLDDRLARGICSTTTFFSSSLTEAEMVTKIEQHLVVEPDCPRLVYTPVIDSLGGSGTSDVRILGFAAFFLMEYYHSGDEIVLKGIFLEELASEQIVPSAPGTVQAVKLIE
ncbi:MAG TPA: hypothetical protein VHS59_09140, partial [Bacillota bacterium]|nr:hypothetical protein [Bacillota bacterium]